MLIEDFVNRETQLDLLWNMVCGKVDQRILLIRGPGGIGKTYLLDECRARCQAEKIACVRIDFDTLLERGYMTIVQMLWDQLGPLGFERLDQALATASNLSPWQVDRDREPPSGGVAFDGSTTIHGDVVGGNVYNINQASRHDHPMVQQRMQMLVTSALRECLADLAGTYRLVFLIDSWQDVPTDTRDWLRRHLLTWVADKTLSQAVMVIAGRELPDVPGPPPRIRELTLPELPEAAVRSYWVERRGLPAEEVPNVIKLSGGLPLTIYLMAQWWHS
jgi:hypothetical protein